MLARATEARAAGAGAGGGVRAPSSPAAVSLARLESLSSASTGVAPPAWPYVEPPTGGACANRSFERSVSRWTVRTVCRS